MGRHRAKGNGTTARGDDISTMHPTFPPNGPPIHPQFSKDILCFPGQETFWAVGFLCLEDPLSLASAEEIPHLQGHFGLFNKPFLKLLCAW